MQIGSHKFDRVEFAGSLGDIGTLVPLSIALVLVNGLSFSSVFLMVGIFYVVTGLYYRLPIPVQPLKVVAAIAIASPEKISLSIMSATGILFGIILLILAFTGIIDKIAGFFTKPIVRGIQLGLGFILITKGIGFIQVQELFFMGNGNPVFIFGISLNLIIGLVGTIIVLLLLSSRRFPAALVIVGSGVLLGIFSGGFSEKAFVFGPTDIHITIPGYQDFLNALMLLVIPQIPLTIGNAVIGTTDTALNLFGKGKETERVSNRGFCTDMGIFNILTGFLAAMPMCHGAGGLAAHYRFGARTGGSNLMIGIVFILIALIFGKVGISLFSILPNAVLGVLLLFAGLELAVLVKDVSGKKDMFIAFLIAGIGLATTNMGIAFIIGIIVSYVIKLGKVEI